MTDRDRPDAIIPAGPLPRDAIAAGFETLIRGRKLFGAELNPTVLKKSGSGASFLVAAVPPMRRLLDRWEELFANRISPTDFFGFVDVKLPAFEHRDNMLLFAKDRVIYDTRICHRGEPTGGLTLHLYREIDRERGVLTALLRGVRLRIVYIERIHLKDQSSGYASSLFRHYEKLFRDLGFNQFRLKASLSVGKYYWAKEGFDCQERHDLERMKTELRAFVGERALPVKEAEIVRLTHAYDMALFRRDLKVSVYRNAEGYYATARDGAFVEECAFPLGKAILLCSEPWDGYKIIYTNTPRRTGFVYSPGYLSHRTPSGHPESGKRLVGLMKSIRRSGLRDSLVFLGPYVPDEGSIAQVHRADFIARFREAARGGQSHFETRDCAICPDTFDVAMMAAGGVMAGVDAVMNGRVDNVFCAVRPPGHHAGAASAMGFCFFNNVAIGAAYARAVYGVKRIFILDWDAHHGNGTQEIFEEDPLTYFCSIHEHPTFCFPGTGRRMERGAGEGRGYTLNVPLRPHCGDRELMDAFDAEVIPEIDRFCPDLIMVSAGFDGHAHDPIADLDLTESSYAHMTRRLCEAADRHCGGRIVSVLEGGYNGVSLAPSVVVHLKALQGRS
jgi:acetoin utilization deacetylase AcuC-like enzyme